MHGPDLTRRRLRVTWAVGLSWGSSRSGSPLADAGPVHGATRASGGLRHDSREEWLIDPDQPFPMPPGSAVPLTADLLSPHAM